LIFAETRATLMNNGANVWPTKSHFDPDVLYDSRMSSTKWISTAASISDGDRHFLETVGCRTDVLAPDSPDSDVSLVCKRNKLFADFLRRVPKN